MRHHLSTWDDLYRHLVAHRTSYSSLSIQAERLVERKGCVEDAVIAMHGQQFVVFPHVYRTGIDTELIIDNVKCRATETFIDIGCGSGVATVFLASRCKSGVAVDINQSAIENTLANLRAHKVNNVTAFRSDVFSEVEDRFDHIIFNPPYNRQPVLVDADRMFWDPGDEAKIRFFSEVTEHLNENGRVYFGWANFIELDPGFPIEQGRRAHLRPTTLWVRNHKRKPSSFFLIEYRLAGSDVEK